MISTVVVGYGLAGRTIHCPLIRRQRELRLHGIVARDPELRAEATATWRVRGYADLDEALTDPEVALIVIATPHKTHMELAVRALEAGKNCVVDKVMAMSAAEADRMIAARDAAGRMLSVFHNRRWDWDYLTVRKILAGNEIGRPFLIESSVCRYAPPRGWRGQARAGGTLLHDWGAHLIDQALQLGLGPWRRLSAWVAPAPWPGIDSGGHGRIMLEFEGVNFQIESSRACQLERPRWWILGTQGAFAKRGIDPQEDALRAGDIDGANEPADHIGHLHRMLDGKILDTAVPSVRGHWDEYYANIAAYLLDNAPLAVTAEQARDVVRILDYACEASVERTVIEAPRM
jgi:scyllo-inositol 2-dehydrogenase (NADP+)